MPIAAYRKWLNCQVQSEVTTAGVEYVDGVERVATDRLLTAKTIGPRFQERVPVGYWDGEMCSSEIAHHGEVNSDDFALAVEN
jgi:hypothetical protein